MRKPTSFFAVILFATIILTGCQSQAERDAEKMAELSCKAIELMQKLSSLDKSSENYSSVAKKNQKMEAKLDSLKEVMEERYTESEFEKVQKSAREKLKDCE